MQKIFVYINDRYIIFTEYLLIHSVNHINFS